MLDYDYNIALDQNTAIYTGAQLKYDIQNEMVEQCAGTQMEYCTGTFNLAQWHSGRVAA